jgi:hypothetical protein
MDKRTVGFVDLPDAALEVIHEYDRDPQWIVWFVIGTDGARWVTRFARMRGIPVLPDAGLEALRACHRVVVGNPSSPTAQQVIQQATAAGIEVVTLETHESGTEGNPVQSDSPDIDPGGESKERSLEDLDTAPEEQPDSAPEPARADGDPTPGSTVERSSEAVGEAEPPAPPSPVSEAFSPSDDPLPAPDLSGVEEEEDQEAPVTADSGSKPAPSHGWSIGRIPFETMDENDPAFAKVLENVLHRTRGIAGSIMVPDGEEGYLHILASSGLPSTIQAQRRRTVEGSLAGEAFTSGKAAFAEASIPPFAEEDTPPDWRFAASLPIQCSGHMLAVLNVTVNSATRLTREDLFAKIQPVLQDAERTLLGAIDLRRLDDPLKTELLLLQVDRALAREETLPDRLLSVRSILQKAFQSDHVHFFMTDVLGTKLQLLTPPVGMGGMSGRFQPMDRGILGWVVQAGISQLLTTKDPRSGEERGVLYIPVGKAGQLQSLYVAENVRMEGTSAAEIVSLSNDVASLIEETFSVERGMGSQALLTELRMRVADMMPLWEGKPSGAKIQIALNQTVDMMAAETAIWVPADGADPVLRQPATSDDLALLSRVWGNLQGVVNRIHANGELAWHPRQPWGEETLPIDVPCLGVRSERGTGALILFFSPDEDFGPTTQVPTSVLLQVMGGVVDIMEDALEIHPLPLSIQTPAPSAGPAAGGPVAEFLDHIRREWRRSLRFGHSFSLTRFRYDGAGDDSKAGTALLRDFLVAHCRAVDIVMEIGLGDFMILSPESERSPDGIRLRLEAEWKAQYPEHNVGSDQKIYPQDGEDLDRYLAWVTGFETLPKAS